MFPFEVTSALLITAALGAMVLAHRERTSPKPTQRRCPGSGSPAGSPTPLPGPGTYARHNAVDMPALLPDGTPSDLSVSEVITGPRGRALSGRRRRAAWPRRRGLDRRRSGPRSGDGRRRPAGAEHGSEEDA